MYMDGYLKQNLDVAMEAVKKDWDMVFCIDGIEGSGKSVIALQMAWYCDNTLTLDRVCFTPKEFQQAVLNAKERQSVIYDEAFTGLSSREAMGKINKSLIKMLAEIRQKNLFVFVVMPSFFDLEKYVALHRSRALVHVYTGDKFERGFFQFYNMERKTNLYVLGKKYYSYFKPIPNFRGRFANQYPISEDEYRNKKKKSLHRKKLGDIDEAEFEKYYIDKLTKKLINNKNPKLTSALKAEILGVSTNTIFVRQRKMREEAAELEEIDENTAVSKA